MQKNIALGQRNSFFFVTGIKPMAFSYNFRRFGDFGERSTWISLQVGSWMILFHREGSDV